MAILGDHPQRNQIIEAIVNGQTARDISRWVNPVASHVTICKLAKSVKADIQAARVVQAAKQLVANTPHCVISATPDVSVSELTKQAATAEPHLERIQENAQRLRRIADRAESEGDLKTAVTAIKTDLTATELSGRFDRSLEAANSTVINVQNVMVLPDRPSAQAPAEEETLIAEYEES